MSSFFSGIGANPFSTAVGQRIERATDAALASEDWALNMEVCDIINETDEGPRDAVKAVKKRLQNNAGKNHTVVLYTLTVLETMAKNCGHRLHVLIASKDFCQELVKMIQPKNDPPQIVQEKVLSLIQTWADAFRGQSELKGVVEVYQELKSKGIEFPMTNLDTLSPIHTPHRLDNEPDPSPPAVISRPPPPLRQTPSQPPGPPRPPMQAAGAPHSPTPPAPAPPAGPVNLVPEQLSKLRGELDIVLSNVKVLGEMLTELQPHTANHEDLQLLHELNRTCRSMQQRIVELVSNVANEEVTEELLRVNDDLNNVFLRYDRFERYRTGQAGKSPTNEPLPAMPSIPPPSQPAHKAKPQKQPEPSLIDLDDDPTPANPDDIHVQLANLDLGNQSVSSQLNKLPSNSTNIGASSGAAGTNKDFDEFAQSRQSKNTGSTYSDNTNIDQMGGSLGVAVQQRSKPKDKDSDYSEMEQWLTEDSQKGGPEPATASGSGGQQQHDAMTSSEFDKFLAERAAAVESSSGQRSKEDVENSLFSL